MVFPNPKSGETKEEYVERCAMLASEMWDKLDVESVLPLRIYVNDY